MITKKVITAKEMLKYETVSQMKADLDNLTGTLRHLKDEDPKVFEDDFYGPYMKDLEDISNNHLGIDLEDIYNEINRLTKLVETLQQSTGQPIIEEQKITIDALTKEKYRLMDRNCELFQLNSALKRNNETLKYIVTGKNNRIVKLEASLKSEEEWSKKLWDENETLQRELSQYRNKYRQTKNAENALLKIRKITEEDI